MKALQHKNVRRVMAFLVLALLFGTLSKPSVAQTPIVTQITGVTATFTPPMAKVTLGDYKGAMFVPPPDNGDPAKSAAAATINVGFSPSFPTGDARTAYLYAAGIWAAALNSAFPISITADWQDLGYSPTGYTLGHGGACNYIGITINSTWSAWFPNALADRLLGYDADLGKCDAQNTFNSNVSVPWYFGTDGNPGTGQIDFVTVVIHELGHGFGFIGSMRVDDGNAGNGVECNGTTGIACWGYSARPFIYDCFAGDGDSKNDDLLIDTNIYANPSITLRSALTNGSVYFGGEAVTHNANNPHPNLNVKLYAPATWSPGSSYSHWDESEFPAGNPNALMTPQLGPQEANHNPGALTLALFDDIGWDGTLPANCTAQYTLTPVTLKSLHVSGLFASGGGDSATIPSSLPIGLGVAAILATSLWLIARRRTKTG